MSLWEEVKSNLVELYSVTSDKTVEVARIGSKKYEKFGISRDIERQFSELGNLVFSSFQEDRVESIKDDEKIIALVERIAGLEKDLKAKEEEINNIREDSARTRERAAAAGAPAEDAPESGTDTGSGEPVETLITDPILQEGGEDAAILMDAGTPENSDLNPETSEYLADGTRSDINKNQG